ncbi:thyrotropin-releasing hormone receptor-like [Neodiprion virginianus]|nr:thyrotropin-releasing hormone receptor-like [Neodiprion virginianus]
MSDYHMEMYTDGSLVPVCLIEANEAWRSAFFVTTIVIFFFVPLFILVILYTIIARHLMANPTISRGPANNLLKYRKQVVLMLGTVVLSFFVCLLPFRAFTLWVICGSQDSMIGLGIDGYYGVLYFSRVMLYLNSAVNPILYNLMSTKFREGFLRLCGIGVKKKAPGRTGTYTTGSTNCSSNHSDFWRRHSSNKSCSVKTPNNPVEKQLKLPLLSSVTDGIIRKKQESYVLNQRSRD